MKTCIDCVFFNQALAKKLDEKLDWGWCRRFPPVWHTLHEPIKTKIINLGQQPYDLKDLCEHVRVSPKGRCGEISHIVNISGEPEQKQKEPA